MAPPDFDRLARNEELAFEDVLECVTLQWFDPMGIHPINYLFREKRQASNAKVEQLKGLVAQLKLENDPKRRAALERMITEANA